MILKKKYLVILQKILKEIAEIFLWPELLDNNGQFKWQIAYVIKFNLRSFPPSLPPTLSPFLPSLKIFLLKSEAVNKLKQRETGGICLKQSN